MTFLLQPPRLLSSTIDEIVRPKHNSNAIDRVIACVTKLYGVVNRRWSPYHVLFVSVCNSILPMSIFPPPSDYYDPRLFNFRLCSTPPPFITTPFYSELQSTHLFSLCFTLFVTIPSFLHSFRTFSSSYVFHCIYFLSFASAFSYSP